MIKKAFYFAFMACLLSSCSEDITGNADEGCVPLSVAGVSVDGIPSVSTRSTTLPNGAAIGISRIAKGAHNAQNNYKYVCSNGVWGADNSNKKILLEGNNNNFTLCAYTPYSSSVEISSIPLQSGLYSSSSDFCYDYKADVNANNMGKGVSFSMNHAYAKLTLRFKKSDIFNGTGDVKKITIAGGAYSANLNLSSDNASVSGLTTSNVDISDGTSAIFNIVSNATYDVAVLMVPCTLSSGLTFTINVDGTNKTATLPAGSLSALVANTNYIIPITISQKGYLDLGGNTGTNYVSITDWVVPSSITYTAKELVVESNSYIVSPGNTIYIPVSRAEKGNPDFKEGSSFSAGFLWFDNSQNGFSISVADRYIKVTAGTENGNAVVYAKNSSNKIVWSWHIWVTDYNPSTTNVTYNNRIWMDRNLGAYNTSDYGLYYQYGRKDPFTGGTNNSKAFSYNRDRNLNSVLTLSTTTAPNYAASIANPTVFYISNEASSDYHWIANYSDYSTDWLPVKSIYDPCPDGWCVPSSKYFSGVIPNKVLPGSRDTDGTMEDIGIITRLRATTVGVYYSGSNSTSTFIHQGSLGIPVRCIQDR